MPERRKLYQHLIREVKGIAGGVSVTMRNPAFRRKNPDHSDFIARMELRAAQAILPGLKRQFASLDLLKTQSGKESRHIRESEDGVKAVILGFANERFYQ